MLDRRHQSRLQLSMYSNIRIGGLWLKKLKENIKALEIIEGK